MKQLLQLFISFTFVEYISEDGLIYHHILSPQGYYRTDTNCRKQIQSQRA